MASPIIRSRRNNNVSLVRCDHSGIRGEPMILLLFFSCLVWSGDEVYVVILKDAKRMEVKQPPVFENGRAILELISGEKVALPASMIDREATKALNEEMALARQQQKRLLAFQEVERQAAAAAARNARQPVVLRHTEDLPNYDDSANSISLTPVEADEPGDSDAATPTDAVMAPNSQPYSKTFSSTEPVYVAAERRTPLPGGGYRVECDIKVNHVTGAENVILTYKANFINAASEQHTIEVTPNKLDFNQTVTIRFNIATNDELFRTEHGVSAEIQP